jgi:two-component system, NarL family, nitrate/nitrite response regulator NarL
MKSAAPITVLLTDDHAIVREGLRSTLSEFPDIQIVGEARDGLEAVEKVKALAPNVVLMDINMPRMNGIEATRRIRKNFPATKILVVTVEDSGQHVSQMLQAGADGYVLKDASACDLAAAIKSVHKGGAVLSPTIARQVVDQFANPDQSPPQPSAVTPREKQILTLVVDGKTNKEIATALNLSVRSIETYRLRLMRRLNVSNAAELTRYALEHQLLG